ncbi:DNA-directed RNA polymerase, mitochondrial [Tribolium castaneum]|uniref:DNA-directed RNA polymerase n=1 Tax=Tribolium castaneum TaxID=7070 RepID=D6WV41_TRICA|nr:PREDICTED: DNA-directed RNA polymerase, mitochondrial [Tribolium castaneum]EFA08534.1 DNA-directed RNA polymerase, mitochondrial-like Protein [Tribolium castaneum]|eukprot:XP_967600.2 PREDICTED: DNA-directed RNA polymerase, mitochondrial [Tribolium castaneum]
MYRLFNTRISSFRKLTNLSSGFNSENVNFKVRDGGGLLNTQLNNYCIACARNQSTNTNPNLAPKKIRKRSKSKKSYYDLLVVTETNAKQQKTSIKKLTWNDLKLLASTNLNLSELHKLKDLTKDNQHVQEHTYNNLAVIDPIAAEETPNEKERVVTITDIPQPPEQPQPPVEELLDTIPKIDFLQPEIIDEPPEISEVSDPAPKINLSKKARYEISVKTLGSYLEMCSTLQTPNRGLNALIFHNQRATRGKDLTFATMKSIKVYNAVLKGFAAKGETSRLEEVLAMVRKENVKLNLQSYIAILECYGRANFHDHYLKQIRIYAKEAVTNGFTFDRMLNEGTFLNDERAVVLATMQKFDPSYRPKYAEPIVQYDNELVNSLNHDSQLELPEEGRLIDETGLFTPGFMQSAVAKQLELEKTGQIVVKSIENRGKVSDEVTKYREIMNQHIRDWEETAAKAFNRDLSALAAQKSPLNPEIYMRSIPLKDFVTILVNEAKQIAEGSETYSPTVNQLYRDLGSKVYARYKILRKQKTGVLDKVQSIHSRYCQSYAHQHEELGVLPETVHHVNPRQQWQWFEYSMKGTGATLTMDHRTWSPSTLQTIGKFLYKIVMHDLKVDVNAMKANIKHKNNHPAFYTVFRTQGRVLKEEVKPHPVLARLFRASMPETLTFPANELPMFCPPVPWTCVDNGGYLIVPCEVVRLPPQATSQKQRLYQSEVQQLYPPLDALNQLAAVAWKVNTDVLDVILEVFNNGGSAKLDVPEPPTALARPQAITNDMDKAQKFKLFRQKLQYRRKKAEMYSLWCDCLYRLSLANHFRSDIFWLPHNMDFRGRVYPVPPHLNHLGSDLARSMLVFAESRPLGPDGLNWLKLHLINLTGLKKRDSITDRLAYADTIMDDILDSADSPLTGRQWWAESEEPWQTLACCIEIAKATRSGNPETYRSHFPVHQDGSCNGLQHYAALGRDSAGAYSVNLCPSEVPQDVYSAVVALVEQQRLVDAANGVEVAKALHGFVKRKVIKQTIMTTVYGVTKYGARLQIARQLKDIDDFPKDLVWAASSYLTGRTFDSLRSMFTSTREIQDWFTDCARLISMSGQHVEWVTPMGLPIVQPYIRYKNLGTSLVYKPYHMDEFEKPNVMKQKNAFPPNFIHSLDSSHMMLTSLFCERAGITFVSVHDCYWTHPSTVDIMNKICREQFVALHSLPILENLSMFLTEKYSFRNDDLIGDGSISDLTKTKLNKVLRKLPKTGDFDITQVLKSVYFFS